VDRVGKRAQGGGEKTGICHLPWGRRRLEQRNFTSKIPWDSSTLSKVNSSKSSSGRMIPGDTPSYRWPDDDKQIKNGAQLIVRESQVVQFVYSGSSETRLPRETLLQPTTFRY